MKSVVVLMALMTMATTAHSEIIADDNAVAQFDDIPSALFDSIRDDYRFFYGHTSHGSQIMTGLDILVDEDPILYARPQFHEYGDDLGHTGDTSWVQPTRDWLDAHPETNVVMWSWCGGCSDNNEEGIATYLAAMSQLEIDYAAVTFVYMTGHLDGSGPDGDLYRNNNQIRDYCVTYDKVLFDFADIESWDPDGNYYPDETDACYWCYDWCAEHNCPDCGSCAHSHCFNCYLKGKGFWWMMATVSGWLSTGVDDPVSLSAPTVRLEQNHPNPFNPTTEIRLTVPESGSGSLSVFNLAGRQVAVLHKGRFKAGERIFRWSGNDDLGQVLPSGSYFCRLRIGRHEKTLKMTLVR